MKDTEFVVNAFRKGMSIEEMNGFAHGLSAQYTEGYGHHEGFDAGDLAIVVMKRDVDVEACSPPDGQSVAETLDRALQQANQTIEYLRNDIDALRKMNAGQSVGQKLNEYINSNVGEHPNDCKIMSIVKVGRGVNIHAADKSGNPIRIYTEDLVKVEELREAYGTIGERNRTIDEQSASMMTVEDAKTLANVAYSRAYSPLTSPSQEDFENWWTEYRKENGFVNEQPERKSKLTSYDVFEQLYEIAKEHLTWHDLAKQVSTKDSDFNKFWTRMQEIYGDGCVSAKGVDAINRGTVQGFSRADYLKLIADEIVANQSEGQDEPTPTDSVFEGIMSELKRLAAKHLEWNEFETQKVPRINSGYGDFYNAISKQYGLRNANATVTKTRKEFFESIANNIIQYRKDNPTEETKPKADAITADEVLPRIKALAAKFFPWDQGLLHLPIEGKHKSVQLFNVLVADEYELELNIEATNKGLQLFGITRLQYLEKVAQAVADSLNK